MVTWYWSANTLFCQVTIDQNMDDQDQRSTRGNKAELVSVNLSVIWSVAAVPRDSVVVVSTCPRAMPVAMITMRKSTHGFPCFFSFDYGAPLGGSSGEQSSANKDKCSKHIGLKISKFSFDVYWSDWLGNRSNVKSQSKCAITICLLLLFVKLLKFNWGLTLLCKIDVKNVWYPSFRWWWWCRGSAKALISNVFNINFTVV